MHGHNTEQPNAVRILKDTNDYEIKQTRLFRLLSEAMRGKYLRKPKKKVNISGSMSIEKLKRKVVSKT